MKRYRLTVVRKSENRPGFLSEILARLAEEDLNVQDISTADQRLYYGETKILVEGESLDQVLFAVDELEQVGGVDKVLIQSDDGF